MRSIPLILVLSLVACEEPNCEHDESTTPEECATGNEPPEVLPCSAFEEDLTLVDHPDRPVDYVIDCKADPRASTLTIEAGVVIEFEPESGIYDTGEGEVRSLGGTGPCEQVVLRGTGGQGSWLGVYIAGGGDNLLASTTVDGAGGGQFNSNGYLGGVLVGSETRLTLRDVTISNSADVGLHAIGRDTSLTLEGANTFTDNAATPVLLDTDLASALRPEDDFTGNGLDVAMIAEGEIEGAHSWEPLNVPYQMTSLTNIFFGVSVPSTASLELQPGVEVAFGAEAGISAVGDLFIEGTATDPVVLRGVEPGAGTWNGILVADPDVHTRTYSIDHAMIDGAGGGQFNSNGDIGGVIVWAETNASVTNTSFTSLGSPCAVNAPYNDDEIDIAGSSTDGGTLLCDVD